MLSSAGSGLVEPAVLELWDAMEAMQMAEGAVGAESEEGDDR